MIEFLIDPASQPLRMACLWILIFTYVGCILAELSLRLGRSLRKRKSEEAAE